MSIQTLEQLKSDEFMLAVGFISTPATLRRLLGRLPEVHAVKDALRQGAITEETIRRFVSSLLADFHPGKQFLHELPLAALAVVLEMRPTGFAEEFLHDLSRLDASELDLCTRVASECLKHRVTIACRAAKTLALSPVDETTAFSVMSGQSRFGKNGFEQTNAVGVCEVS